MCPSILDFECQVCFITDLKQVFNRVGCVSVCIQVPVTVFHKFSGKRWQAPCWLHSSREVLSSSTMVKLKISHEVSFPLPCTLPFHISKIRKAFLLHSPFPGCAASKVERNVSCALQESSREVGTVHTSRDGAGATFPFTDPKGAGAGSSSQRDQESASLYSFLENYAPVFKQNCSWCSVLLSHEK